MGDGYATTLDEVLALRSKTDTLTAERDGWKTAFRQLGGCMTCALHAPEPYGCSDCLNTGWDGGAPIGFARTEAVTTLEVENAKMKEALTYYADQFCEHGTSYEGCGKLPDDDCAGCKARAALT